MSEEEEKESQRSKISDLERLLDKDDEVEIEIMPNGEVRSKPSGEHTLKKKPLTFRDNLGGEYGIASPITRAKFVEACKLIENYDFPCTSSRMSEFIIQQAVPKVTSGF